MCAPFVVCCEAFCEDTGGAMADTAGSGADDVDPFAFVPKVCKTLLPLFLSLSSTSWSPLNGSVLFSSRPRSLPSLYALSAPGFRVTSTGFIDWILLTAPGERLHK